jgi:hypothetical protein
VSHPPVPPVIEPGDIPEYPTPPGKPPVIDLDRNPRRPPVPIKDLYVFCFDAETGEIRANGVNNSIVGKNVKTLQDKNGYYFGEEFYKNAVNGEFREVPYWKPRPGQSEPSEKSSYVTRVRSLGCGVGYYKK